MPDDAGEYILDTDASDKSIGAVLSQRQGGLERVIAYASRALDRRETNYCTTRRELLAIVHFLKYFKQYLLGRTFKVRTDHSALTWLRRTPDPIGQQARWLEQLEEFDFTVEHRPGSRHGNADGLSRRPCVQRNCACKEPSKALFDGPADRATIAVHDDDETTVKMLAPSRGLTRLSPIAEVDESEETEVKQRACRYIDQHGDADHRVAGDEMCHERACRQAELHQSGSEPHNDVATPVSDAEPHVGHTSEPSQQNLWEPGVLQRAQQGDPDIAYVYNRIPTTESQQARHNPAGMTYLLNHVIPRPCSASGHDCRSKMES